MDFSMSLTDKYGMSIGFDPIACCFGIIAIAVTLYQVRRTYSAILKVERVESSGCQSLFENNSQFFYKFRLFIRNAGRPLHNVSVAVGFRAPDGSGWFTIPLHHFSPDEKLGGQRQEGEFAQGMVGEFGLNTYQLDYGRFQMLAALKDPVEQDAEIVVYSHGYLSARFKVGIGIDLVKRRWNQAAWRINPMFDSTVTPKGTKKKLHKSGKVLPVFPCLDFAVRDFIRNIQTLPKPPQPPLPVFQQGHPFFSAKAATG